jgi:hypothetical protein
VLARADRDTVAHADAIYAALPRADCADARSAAHEICGSTHRARLATARATERAVARRRA